MRSRVCAVVEAGGVPGRNPLLPPLAAILAGAGVELVTWDPTPGFSATAPGAPEADLYLLKGDHPAVATAGGCLADAGAPCLNTLAATSLARDKARALARASSAGVPVPASTVVGDPAALAAAVAAGQRVVKPLTGAHGSGVARVGPGDPLPTGPGPWLVQEPVEGDGFDRKVYGVGTRTALRRMRFSPGRVDGERLPCPADPNLERHAGAAAAACGLVCWGADFVVGPDGPVLVDLNAFPGYRGVPEGPAWVAEAVLSALRGREEPAA
ncbi:MAG TPA: hypothetical protein VM324_05325 [Egibacteraceae bacterium]|nr:hypothetical protein [Egibacteraceae bacterium]